MRLAPARAALIGAAFATLVTLPGLGAGTLWDNSETAYGEVAREILLTHDAVVMHLNGAPWFIQPPLYFWLAALFAKLFGVTSFALRLPSALATIAMAGAVGYATARIAGTRAGLYAAIILSSSLMQAIVGRLAIMDALLDLAVAASVLWWFRALDPPRDGAPEAPIDERKRALAFIFGAIAAAFGILTKGPVALVVPGAVIVLWMLWQWRRGEGIIMPRVATLVVASIAFLGIALPWFVLLGLSAGMPALVDMIGHYTVGRYTGVIENQRGPFFYYLPVLILGFFPWVAFLPRAFAIEWKIAQRPEGSLARLAFVWALFPFVFFSIAQTKLPNYIALEWPALAILVALWFTRVSRGADRRAAVGGALAVPLTIGCIAIAIYFFAHINRLDGDIVVVLKQLVILGIGIFIGSLATVVVVARERTAIAAPFVLACSSAALVLFIAFIAEPAAEPLKPVPSLAALIEARRSPGDTIAIRGVSGGNALVFYTKPGVKTIESVSDVVENDAAFTAFLCANGPTFMVTKREDVGHLIEVARVAHRGVQLVGTALKDALIHIDGSACAKPN